MTTFIKMQSLHVHINGSGYLSSGLGSLPRLYRFVVKMLSFG